MAVVVFIPSLWAGYLADDNVMLRTISVLRLPWQAFTHTDIATIRSHPYRPIWVLYNALLKTISSSAVLHHAGNLALFAGSCVLVIVIAQRIVDMRVAYIAGLAFAVYPRHGESVAWIAGSTDLLAGFLVLLAVGLLTSRGAPRWATNLGVVVGVLAPLAKESGFVIPALATVVLLATWQNDDEIVRHRRVVSLAVLAVGVVFDLVIRTAVLHGTGNDVTEPFGVHRLVTVLGSQIIATVTSSRMLVLVHPSLFFIAAAIVALLLVGVVQIFRSRDVARRRLLFVGVAWYVISLLPIYNNAVALNNSNGERLLFLPSVGLIFVIAAAVSPLVLRNWGRVVVTLAMVGLGTVSVLEASDYATAGTISQRVVAETVQLAHRDSTIVLLNIPDSYRGSRLLGAGFAQAVARAGRRDVTVLVCAPSIIESLAPQRVTFVAQGAPGVIVASSSSSLPFETPSSGRQIQSTGCTYQPATSGRIAPGLYQKVNLTLTATSGPTQYLWFNGVDVKECTLSVCSGILNKTH